MKKNSLRALVCVCAFAFLPPLDAEETPAADSTATSRAPEQVDLQTLVDLVSRKSGKQFLLEPRVRGFLTVAGIEPDKVTYPILLQILRLNGYAVVTLEGVVNVVPDATRRQLPTPVIDRDDPAIPADEWVTRIVTPKYLEAARLVPILRPMMQQAGHMAAIPQNNKLILVDTYANTQWLAEMVKRLDVPGAARTARKTASVEPSN